MPTTAVVLAMHGAPPVDFPRDELAEMLGLHMRLEQPAMAAGERTRLEARHAGLDARIRSWPRTPETDPFFGASVQLAERLGAVAGCPVFLGFNEFCSPSVDEALDKAVATAA
jgi:sirohydrochlorin cobaltochelatase